MGAVVGGVAQNLSFVVGMKALLLLTALFYVLAVTFSAISHGHLARAARPSRYGRPEAAVG